MLNLLSYALKKHRNLSIKFHIKAWFTHAMIVYVISIHPFELNIHRSHRKSKNDVIVRSNQIDGA